MSTLQVTNIQDTAGANSLTTAQLYNGAAKAWVNFNGTTSPGTIRASYNVSSVTKNGTGDFTVNLTNSLVDANYSSVVTVGRALGGSALGVVCPDQTAPTSNTSRIVTFNNVFSLVDPGTCSVSIFR